MNAKMHDRLSIKNFLYRNIARVAADHDRLQCPIDDADDESAVRMDSQHLIPDLFIFFRRNVNVHLCNSTNDY